MTTNWRTRGYPTFGSDADAGVGQGIGDVGQQVDGDVGEADGKDASLDQGIIAVGDGGKGEAADAGPGEDRLGDDGAGEQAAELQAKDGEHGNEGVGKRVAENDGMLGQALGAGGADVVLVQLFEHGGAHHAGQDSGQAHAEGDGGENEIEEELPTEDGAGARAGDGQPAKLDGEDEDEYGAQREVGKRESAERGDAQDAVGPASAMRSEERRVGKECRSPGS